MNACCRARLPEGTPKRTMSRRSTLKGKRTAFGSKKKGALPPSQPFRRASARRTINAASRHVHRYETGGSGTRVPISECSVATDVLGQDNRNGERTSDEPMRNTLLLLAVYAVVPVRPRGRRSARCRDGDSKGSQPRWEGRMGPKLRERSSDVRRKMGSLERAAQRI